MELSKSSPDSDGPGDTHHLIIRMMCDAPPGPKVIMLVAEEGVVVGQFLICLFHRFVQRFLSRQTII